MRRLVVLTIFAAATAMPAHGADRPGSAVTRAQSGDSIEYRVKPGDTLYALAQRYLRQPGHHEVVRRLNRIRDPLRIPPGTLLRVPTALLKFESQAARIVATRGQVRVNATGMKGNASVGLLLPEGSQLQTEEGGFASLLLPNGSRSSLPPGSRLTIRLLRRYLLTGSIDYDLVIDSGKVETEAAPLGPNGGRFRIHTPRAVAAVRGTRFRVGYANTDSGTEVLEGVVAAGAGERLDRSVETGFGLLARANGATALEQLLPAPELLNPGRVQVDPLVALAVSPVDGAKGYRIQLSPDAGFVDVTAEQLVASPLASFANLPNGSWFVRTTAIAGSGLEGLASVSVIRRVLTGLAASADGDASRMRFRWDSTGEGAKVFRFQLRKGAKTGITVIDEAGLTASSIALRDLEPGRYFWRVAVRQASADGVTENWLPFSELKVPEPEK